MFGAIMSVTLYTYKYIYALARHAECLAMALFSVVGGLQCIGRLSRLFSESGQRVHHFASHIMVGPTSIMCIGNSTRRRSCKYIPCFHIGIPRWYCLNVQTDKCQPHAKSSYRCEPTGFNLLTYVGLGKWRMTGSGPKIDYLPYAADLFLHSVLQIANSFDIEVIENSIS